MDANRMTKREYQYRGYIFRQTDTMTTVYYPNNQGYNSPRVVPLYEIDGLKPCGKRPLLTTIEQCKEYIKGVSENA